MVDLPLHPALVHIPVGVALLIPLLAVAALVQIWSVEHARRSGWLLVVAAQAFALAGGLAAARTGEDDEERVERIVAKAKIEEHEDGAEVFNGLAAAALIAGGAALTLRRRARRTAALLSLVLSIAAAGQAVRVGHSGGTLVYREGAAAAHAPAAGQPTLEAPHDDD